MDEINLILSKILPKVNLPSRYIDSYWNRVIKDKRGVKINFLIFFPDAFEIGMSNLGIKILYHILKNIEGVDVELVFSPWVDFEREFRRENIPLISLESGRRIKDFDIIGVSLQNELSYTNLITFLELSDITIKSIERKEGEPFIIGGGPSALNPEPIAEVFDGIFIGEAEEGIIEILEAYKKIKEPRKNRELVLKEWSKIESFYIPSFYKVINYYKGYSYVVPKFEDLKEKLSKRQIKNLDDSFFPVSPIVSLSRIVHDRVAIEVSRGCKHLCRFCPASMTSKPLRNRSAQKVVKLAKESILNTGYSELSLLAFNITDYPFLNKVLEELIPWCEKEKVAVSLPSIRPGSLTKTLVNYIGSIRKTGFTLAPEVASERLRAIINKPITFEDLKESAIIAFSMGWTNLKLYFMAGLPTETEQDLLNIYRVAKYLLKIGKKIMGKKVSLHISISFLVPKPHTPFQWVGQDDYETLVKKKIYLKKLFKRERKIIAKISNPFISKLEALFSRGSRDLFPLILEAQKLGCRFDSWDETFNKNLWEKALKKFDIDIDRFTSAIYEVGDPLPWEHILTKRKKYIVEDFQRFEKLVGHRIFSENFSHAIKEIGNVEKYSKVILVKDDKKSSQIVQRLRAQYRVEGNLRFLAHLDNIRIITMALKKAGIPLYYTKGYHPHPKISFSPPLPVGFESKTELFDIYLRKKINPQEFIIKMNRVLPENIEIIRAKSIPKNSPKINEIIKSVSYDIIIPVEIFKDTFRDINYYVDKIDGLMKSGHIKKRYPNIVEFQSDILPGVGIRIFILQQIKKLSWYRVDNLLEDLLELGYEEKSLISITREQYYQDISGKIRAM